MTLLLLMLIISLFMIFLKHPLSMGLMILFQTLLICLLSGFFINTYWFSYILFLTFLGGLLVLFIYISSIASNELFNISFINKMFIPFIIFIIIILSWMLKFNLKLLNYSINFNEMNNFFNYLFLINNKNYNMISLTKLYNKHNYFLMLMLIIYLFITLVAIIKITNIFYGPLRSFN
uniref:NADH dehydrogenase subunit 6 n=1 Tax=Lotongus taprobanus TaxID=3043259 RepID=UPI002551DB04|nr:NADH dehydrogenase subunit 6 [Lotongus taprobanus]WGM81114.1 NADH dehydrogenase subunit 6 [Lotongus taprobanus]